MLEKQRFRKTKRLLSLLLVIVLLFGIIPVKSVLAEENEVSQETEGAAEDMEPDTDGESEGGVVENTEPDSEEALSEETESDSEEVPSEETEPVTYANSIGGTIWLDANEDGVFDSGEALVVGYKVSLYLASDTDNAVETAITNGNGEYTFENLTPDDYVVGIPQYQSVSGTKYLFPMTGISGDNKFILDEITYNAYTNIISIASDTEASGYHAGVCLPPSIQTTSAQISKTAYTINRTVVGYAGHEWWVIGDSGTGVTSPANSLTLWSKNHDWQIVAFNSSVDNNYQNSALKTAMNNLNNSLFTSGNILERNYVINRASMDLFDENGNNTYGFSPVLNQMFWPISQQEWDVIRSKGMSVTGSYTYSYWLRTTVSDKRDHIMASISQGLGTGAGKIGTPMAVRPAFYLNLSSALFTSPASGTGMKPAAGNPSLEAATPTTGTIKFTMTDDVNLKLNTTTTLITAPPSGGTRTFDYSGAKTGTNKSVSVLICDQETGDIMYYGRPVNLNGGSSSGIATFTVPSGLAIGNYTMKVFNEEVNGNNYTDYASTPKELTLRIAVATVDLSANPDSDKVYSGTVDITAIVKNLTGQPASTIEDLEWFRVPVSDAKDYSSSFDSTYRAAASVNKGVIPDKNLNELTETFHLAADKNANYWFKGTVKDGATTYTAVECITVDNLYRQISLSLRGEINGSSPTAYLYGYEAVDGTYGIPYDLNGTTVLSAPHLGFDKVKLNPKEKYKDNWTSAMKSGSALPFVLTLNGAFLSNTQCDNRDVTKYTIVYTKNGRWKTITAHFVDESGSPLTSVGGLTSEPFDAPLNASGDVTDFLSSGGSYAPPTVTNYVVIGYKVGSAGTFEPFDFTAFDPHIPVTSSGITDVYIVYQALTTDLKINKNVSGTYGDPNKAFEITITLVNGGTPVTGTYSYSGSAINGVTAPPSGSITFDASGRGTVSLKHGQTITITGLFQTHTYRVQETDAAITGGLYDVAYSGTGTVNGSGSSASISETLGSTTAAVSIANARNTVPDSGLNGTDYRLAAVGTLTMSSMVLAALWNYRRRRK